MSLVASQNSMWDLSRPGIEPASPAFAGRFFTTEPLEKLLCLESLLSPCFSPTNRWISRQPRLVPDSWREGRLQQSILHLCKAKQKNLRKTKWILVLISMLMMSSPLVIFSLCLMTVLMQPWAGGRGPLCFLFPQKLAPRKTHSSQQTGLLRLQRSPHSEHSVVLCETRIY